MSVLEFSSAGWIDASFCDRLATTLLHFLWQGLLIAVLLRLALACVRRSTSWRYRLSVLALLAMVVAMPATFVRMGESSSPPPQFAPASIAVTLPAPPSAVEESFSVDPPPTRGETAEPIVAASPSAWRQWRGAFPIAATTLYLLGATMMLVRLAAGLWGGWRLRRDAKQIAPDSRMSEFIDAQSRRFGLWTRPMVAYCDRVRVPVVVGLLRPAVLLPASLATGLAPDQLETIFLHELAHIRRCDLLINLFQRLAESLLFFHPAVWYVSRRISLERELCCDDMVLAAGCDHASYAQTLVRMAELCCRGKQAGSESLAALAASGDSPSELKRRVQRLLDCEPRVRLSRWGLLLTMTMIAVLVAAPFAVHTVRAQRQRSTEASTGASQEAAGNKSQDKLREVVRLISDQTHALEDGELDVFVSHFSADLRAELSKEAFQKLWEEMVGAIGPIRDVDYYRSQAVGVTSLYRFNIEGSGDQSIDLLFQLNDQALISGLWLVPTPAERGAYRPNQGYRFGEPIREIATWKHSLTVEVQPPEGSSDEEKSVCTVDFYRELSAGEVPTDRDWVDPVSNKTWRYFRRVQDASPVTATSLKPGWYRAVAGIRSTTSGPTTVGDPIELVEQQLDARQSVRLAPAATVFVTGLDSDSGQALEQVSCSLKPVTPGRPSGFVRAQEIGDRRGFTVAAGKYQVLAFKRAPTWDGLRYDSKPELSVFDFKAGETKEIKVKLFSRKLTQKEIDAKVPWIATGRVTDVDGNPLSGVEIWGSAGIGSLFSMKVGTTDEDGRYFGRFGTSGWSRLSYDPQELEIVSGQVGPQLEGYFVANVERQRPTAAANRLPRAGEDARWAEDHRFFLPGKPLEVNFVMQRAANLTITLVDADGKPMPKTKVGLTGDDLKATVKSVETDEQGRCELAVPAGFQFRVRATIGEREYALSPSMAVQSRQYNVALRQEAERLTGNPILALMGAGVFDATSGITRQVDILKVQPMEQAPLPEKDQEVGREFLKNIREANKYWLGNPPKEVKQLEYDFVFASGKKQHIRWNGRSIYARRGISYYSPLDIATRDPEQVVFRAIEVDERELRLSYSFKNLARVSAGNGVQSSWSGFFSMGVSDGTLVVDAKTLAPLEHRAKGLTETFSNYVHVADGHHVPLRIQIDKMNFDWTFKLHPGRLWLFDRTTPTEESPEPKVQVRNVSLGPELDKKRPQPFDPIARLESLIGRLEGKPDRAEELSQLKQELSELRKSKGEQPDESVQEDDNDATRRTSVRTEHVVVVGNGVSEDYLRAIGKTIETARTICGREFGYEMPGLIRVSVEMDPNQPARLFNDGVDQFVLSVRTEDDLRRPSESKIYHLYGLCHEVAHLAMYRPIRDHSWMSTAAAEGWAHYLGSHLVDRVFDREGEKLWPDSYDYRADGTARLKRQLAATELTENARGAKMWQDLMAITDHTTLAKVFASWGSASPDPADPRGKLETATMAITDQSRVRDWWDRWESLLVVKRDRSQTPAGTVARQQLTGNARQLRHDDGKSAGMRSIAGSGHAVRFRSDIRSYLTKVKVFGARYGQAAAPPDDATVWICDAEMKVISSFKFPYARFQRGTAKWVDLEIDPTSVPKEFVVCVGFNPSARSGVYVHHDARAAGHSMMGLPGRAVRDFSSGDWLIRVETDSLKATDARR